MTSPLAGLKVGYVPYSSELTLPGDRRRFAFYAQNREVRYEIAHSGGDYDVVVLSERADILTWSRQAPRTKIVYDLIDSYLSVPRWSPVNTMRGIVRFATGEQRRPTVDYHAAVEAMCRRADAVVCSTAEQRTRISEHCSNVHIVLDAHGADVTSQKTEYSIGSTLEIVWEGLPYTLGQLAVVVPALRTLAREIPVRLHVVTDPVTHRLARWMPRPTQKVVRELFTPSVFHPWEQLTLSKIVTACDVAIIPLRIADPLAAGKPENKLLLLWRMGMPVVASATPAYQRAMDAAGVSSYCLSVADWQHWITVYSQDHAARANAGRRGRAYVDREHSDEQILSRWDRVFDSVLR